MQNRKVDPFANVSANNHKTVCLSNGSAIPARRRVSTYEEKNNENNLKTIDVRNKVRYGNTDRVQSFAENTVQSMTEKKQELQLQLSGLNARQLKAFNLIVFEKQNVHIAGAAGTGKSHLLSYTVRALKRLGRKVAITATTGVAADNLNHSSMAIKETACTINSWMGCGWCTDTAEKEAFTVKHYPKTWDRWKDTDVLIIDEISMMHPKFFVKIDHIARILRSQPDLPFGGLQMVLCGDWFQLEPVDKYDNFNQGDGSSEPRVQFCMETASWREAITHENVIILTENFRQQRDPVFQKLLSEIRQGILSTESEALLQSRIGAPLEKIPSHIKPTFLLSLDLHVKQENKSCLELQKDGGEIKRFFAKHTNFNLDDSKAQTMYEQLKKQHRIQEVLELKLQVPVMLLINLCVREGFVNGMQGIVQSFDPADGYPIVRWSNNQCLKIVPHCYYKQADWKRNSRDQLKFGVSIEQLPLVLSYALTIHKVQSLTLTAVKLDLGSNIFAGGQAYVALSRPKTLDGLCLTAFDRNSIRINPRVIKWYDKYQAYENRIIDDGCTIEGLKNEIIDFLDTLHPYNSIIAQGRTSALKRPRRKNTNSNDPENLSVPSLQPTLSADPTSTEGPTRTISRNTRPTKP